VLGYSTEKKNLDLTGIIVVRVYRNPCADKDASLSGFSENLSGHFTTLSQRIDLRLEKQFTRSYFIHQEVPRGWVKII